MELVHPETELRSVPHPCGPDLAYAEVWRVMWLELALGMERGETTLDVCARVAMSLGACARGALRDRLHGPVLPLDGSAIAANRSEP